MSRPEVKEHNATTDETIVREMNDEELQEHSELQKNVEAAKQAAKQAATDKAALLERLGITTDEAKLLLS